MQCLILPNTEVDIFSSKYLWLSINDLWIDDIIQSGQRDLKKSHNSSNVKQLWSGPVFCLLLRVNSDYAQPITGQVAEVTCPVMAKHRLSLLQVKDKKRALLPTECISSEIRCDTTVIVLHCICNPAICLFTSPCRHMISCCAGTDRSRTLRWSYFSSMATLTRGLFAQTAAMIF